MAHPAIDAPRIALAAGTFTQLRYDEAEKSGRTLISTEERLEEDLRVRTMNLRQKPFRIGAWLWAAWLAAFALPAAAVDSRELQTRIDTDDFGLLAPISLGEPLKLWATWYQVHAVDAIPDGVRLLDVAGAPISPPVPGRDWCLGALQGVIMIKANDGTRQTYTYETTAPKEEVDCVDYFKHPASWTRAAGRSRFGVSRGPFGDGAGGFQVVPFRSIAVDTRLIPLGTVLYIPAARGTAITLPSGRKVVHDGYFFASDRGGAIKDNHIDVFAGLWPENPFPSFIWSTETRTFEAYVIADEIVKPRLYRLHALDGGDSMRYAGELGESQNAAGVDNRSREALDEMGRPMWMEAIGAPDN